MKNFWITIPARKNSKGFPNKNRYLFDYTARQIPKYLCDRTIVTTDDEELIHRAEEYGFKTLQRGPELSRDDTSMKFVIKDVIQNFNITSDQDLITLYLTYPQRKFEEVERIYDFYLENQANSLLCGKSIGNHPYMSYYTLDNYRGAKVVNHKLYRRQDYPACFEVCHYVVIVKSKAVDELDKNLYCEDTLFYSLENKIFDVDYLKDFNNFKGENRR